MPEAQSNLQIDPGEVRLIVIDLETTGREPSEAHIVEWATVEVRPEFFGEGGMGTVMSQLVRPPIPIPPETSAIHHIVDADVRLEFGWDVWGRIVKSNFAGVNVVGVAHNAEYERTCLASLELTVPWICTYKAALRIWPDCPSHSNECLRYYLGLGGGRQEKQAPHSAAHDVLVTAQILQRLMHETSLENLIRWTDEPAMLPRCPIGSWRNHPWSEVEYSFLEWIIYKARDMREDIRFCAQTEIARRKDEYRKTAHPSTQAPNSADDDENETEQ